MRDKIAGLDGQTEFVSEFRRRSLFTRSGLAAAPAVMAGVTYIRAYGAPEILFRFHERRAYLAYYRPPRPAPAPRNTLHQSSGGGAAMTAPPFGT